jgi:hypothetical protein
MTLAYPWRGMRGLGQCCADAECTVLGPPCFGQGAPTSTAPWLVTDIIAPVLKAGSTIASYELNPLYQKATYYQTPQGAVYTSNVPSGYVPGLTTASGGISLLPILLIGGLVLLFVARR